MSTATFSDALYRLVEEVADDFGDFESPRSGIACWERLRICGTRLWLDTGDIALADRLWNPAFDALTTNNTLLNREVQKGIYDEIIARAGQLVETVAPHLASSGDAILEIAGALNALHGLRLVRRFGGKVSIELHTELADDAVRSVAYGRRLHAVCPTHFVIKVPYTPAGLFAARALRSEGIPVNLTLGFSARQNVLAAYVASPAYVNVFLGRLNALVADNGLGSGQNVGERTTLSTQREISALRRSGVTSGVLIGASMRDRTQIIGLAGIDVMTLPPGVATEYAAGPTVPLNSALGNIPDADCPDLECFDDLWHVSSDFRRLAEQCRASNDTDELLEMVGRNGFGHLFPDWSDQDRRTLLADGKIPVYDHWRERIENGSIGLDALMCAAARYSFTSDQAQLDRRIVEKTGLRPGKINC